MHDPFQLSLSQGLDIDSRVVILPHLGDLLARNVLVKLHVEHAVFADSHAPHDASRLPLGLEHAKPAHGYVVKVGHPAAPGLPAVEPPGRRRELSAVVVEVLPEVDVDALPHGPGEAVLGLGVAVPKVMSVAALGEVETGRLVGRQGAAVRGPVAVERDPDAARVLEVVHGHAEDESVGHPRVAEQAAALELLGCCCWGGRRVGGRQG